MNLSGVFAPIPTPFDDRDEVDTGRLRTALARWLATPLTGFVVLGSNGEAVYARRGRIRPRRSRRRASRSREAGRFSSARGASRRARPSRASRRAADLGADAVLVRTPGFFKTQMTTDAFVRHYTAVADASPVPVLLYNFTALTGVNLLPAAVTTLAAHPNIIGMKESGGDLAQIGDLVSGTPGDFTVLAGTTSTFYAALARRLQGRHPRARLRRARGVRPPVSSWSRPAATTRRSRSSAS